MIHFFRRIRQRLLSRNKLNKYFLYAVGEILLVVIGILIALQVNTWNQERIQENELEDILKSLESGIKTDLRSLDLVSKARANMVKRVDSVYHFIPYGVSELKVEEAFYISESFDGFASEIFFQTNESAFQSLINSVYFSKLQNTDIETLLAAYYSKVRQIERQEERHNKIIAEKLEAWFDAFEPEYLEIFQKPYFKTLTADYYSEKEEFFKILRDPQTLSVISHGRKEPELIRYYNELKLIGTKFIEMVERNEFELNEKDKLELTSVLPFMNDEYLPILYNGRLSSLFGLFVASSNGMDYEPEVSADFIVLDYPKNMGFSPPYTSPWLAVQIFTNALNGRVKEIDLSMYSKLIIEMKGNLGGEVFQVAVKDVNDPFDGSEARETLKLSSEWQTFEVPLTRFKTADLKLINVPLAIIFTGQEGMVVHLKSVKFE